MGGEALVGFLIDGSSGQNCGWSTAALSRRPGPVAIAVGVIVLVVAGISVAIAVNHGKSTVQNRLPAVPTGSEPRAPRRRGCGRCRPGCTGGTFADESSAGAAALDDQVATITALPAHARHPHRVRSRHRPGRVLLSRRRAAAGVVSSSGELVDSESIPDLDPTEYEQRAVEYLDEFGASVDLWEVGNEVNGNWTGDYSDVGDKITPRRMW